MDMEESPLTDKERALFTAVLNCIIPASPDGRMPSASEYDVWDYVARQAPELQAWL